ncbi:MAG: DUF4252 domain-containing protein [Saprospiraceae bacterium]
MKQIYLLLAALFLLASLASAQQEPLNNFIEKHKRDKGFTFVYLSKDLLEVVAESKVEMKDWHKLHNVVKNIGSLRVLASGDNADAPALYKEALKLVPTDEMDVLLTVRDGQDRVYVWSKDDGQAVTDLILLVGTTDDFVLVCFAGQLELGNVSELARMFNSEAVEQLAQATEAVSIEFGISPNPSRGTITLNYADADDSPAMLTLVDPNGRLVASQKLAPTTTQQLQFPELPAGLYWVQLRTEKGKIGVKQIQIVH